MCIFKYLIGAALIIGGIIVEASWLVICFGSVILGLALLFFAPGILFFPFTFGTATGMAFIVTCQEEH